jgi:predicted metal-binding membrane protein
MMMVAEGSATPGSPVASATRWRRDRWVILGGVGCIAAAAWIYVLVQARQISTGVMTTSMGGAMQSAGHAPTWTAVEFALMLLMWAVMMVAMMLPSALPMTLVYAAVVRTARGQHPMAPTSLFIAGYLTMWGLFALAATAVQMVLSQSSVLTSAMAVASPRLAGGLLIAAGAYELTPLKHACLAQCRAPARCIARHGQAGPSGGLWTGLALGATCLGCCWILMGLLFVGGVMNLEWIAAIALFILFEKTATVGVAAGRVAGALLVLLGVLSLTGAIGVT